MEENQEYESTNIHTKWLENIFEELKNIQSMERLAREGCNSLIEYFQIPFQSQAIIIPDLQYKNIRFFVLEMQTLISNLAPVIKDKEEFYKNKLKPIAEVVNKRELFLKEIRMNNQNVMLQVLPYMNKIIDMLSLIKSLIIKDIGHILYMTEDKEQKKKW